LKKNKNNHARNITLKEAAEVLGVKYSTIRNWSRRDDAPLSRNRKTKAITCNADELRAWAEALNLTGKVGRPVEADDDENSPNYWLGRLRKVKALEAEGAVIAKTDHLYLISNLASTAATKLRKLPSAAAPGCFGKSVQEIEAELERFVQDICADLSDPKQYELKSERDTDAKK
jgi:predicted DNA-binding transcriptional regulator AlpA